MFRAAWISQNPIIFSVAVSFLLHCLILIPLCLCLSTSSVGTECEVAFVQADFQDVQISHDSQSNDVPEVTNRRPVSPQKTQRALADARAPASEAEAPVTAKADTTSRSVEGDVGGAQVETHQVDAESATTPNEDTQSLTSAIVQRRGAYLASVIAAIETRKFYPSIAQRLRQVGKVIVSFTVHKNGSISGIQLAQGSEFELLNGAALRTLENIVAFEPIPNELGLDQWQMKVPINFTLN